MHMGLYIKGPCQDTDVPIYREFYGIVNSKVETTLPNLVMELAELTFTITCMFLRSLHGQFGYREPKSDHVGLPSY
jgi:hypothetical protein